MRKTNFKSCKSHVLKFMAIGVLTGAPLVACKSRLFSFGEGLTTSNQNTPAKDLATGGVAIGDNGTTADKTPIAPDSAGAAGNFVAVQGEKKEISIGNSVNYLVNG